MFSKAGSDLQHTSGHYACGSTRLLKSEKKNHSQIDDGPQILHQVSQAFFAKPGRRYGVNNRKDTNGRLNGKDKDGKIKLCRGCNSPWHLVYSCDRVKKAPLVNLVLDLPIPQVGDFPQTK